MATILAIVGVGLSLAALHVSLFRLLNVRIRDVDTRVAGVEKRLEQRIAGVEGRLEQRIAGVDERLQQHMTGLEREMSDVRERMAKLEGAVTGFMAGHRVGAA